MGFLATLIVGLIAGAFAKLLMPGRERGLEVVKMEFRRFLNAIMLIPCQIVRTARRVI